MPAMKSIDQLRFTVLGLGNGLRSKSPIRLRFRRRTAIRGEHLIMALRPQPQSAATLFLSADPEISDC